MWDEGKIQTLYTFLSESCDIALRIIRWEVWKLMFESLKGPLYVWLCPLMSLAHPASHIWIESEAFDRTRPQTKLCADMAPFHRAQEHIPWGTCIWVTLFPGCEHPLICHYWQTPPDPLDVHLCPLLQCWTNRWSSSCSENQKVDAFSSGVHLAILAGWIPFRGHDLLQVFTVNRFTMKDFSIFPHSRLLWVLHQMFRWGAVRIAGGYNPLLLWCRPVLRVRTCGSHRHGHHSGSPLLQGHQWPRHADWRVSVVIATVIQGDRVLCYVYNCAMTSPLEWRKIKGGGHL